MQLKHKIFENKIIRNLIFICAFVIVFLIAFYFAMANYYKNHYIYNTWINGYYCTGLSSEEALELVSSEDVVPSVTVIALDGSEYNLDMSHVEYEYDYGDLISNILEEQNAYKWLGGFKEAHVYTVEPIFSIAENDMRQSFEKLPFVKDEINTEPDYIVYYSEELGKFTYSNNLLHRLDVKQAFNDLHEGVIVGINSLTIDESYYFDYEPNLTQKNRMEYFELVDKYQNCDLVYDMGDELIEFTPELMVSFSIKVNGFPLVERDGSFVLNISAVDAWIQELCEEYDTFEKERLFESSRGETVVVKAGNYGTLLDGDTESLFLKENLLSEELHDGALDNHIPSYLVEANFRGKNDIGDSFVEIDITNQHLYFYKNGTLMVESDIVSGNVRTRDDTAEGVYSITGTDVNRYLLGSDYTSFVNYWMPFFGNSGICDSTWREEYGGDIYLTQGTHGQVNVPLDVAEIIFNEIEVGNPVVVY